MIIAFECYADEDLVTFAAETFGSPLRKAHEGVRAT